MCSKIDLEKGEVLLPCSKCEEEVVIKLDKSEQEYMVRCPDCGANIIYRLPNKTFKQFKETR